jgi:hypothetical protein
MSDLCVSGHKFESRYITRAPNADQIHACDAENFSTSSDIIELVEALTSKIYVCDICTVCGLTVGAVSKEPVADGGQ